MIKNLYNCLRDRLPLRQRIQLSRAVFFLTNKPYFSRDNKVELKRGIVCMSADFELAWARRYSKRNPDALCMARQERENLPLILKRMNQLEIPATWATVGHLFLDNCERRHSVAHPEMPRPEYFENALWRFAQGDWYDCDPCGDFKSYPEFYAPDLIELILESPVTHEIACHSFSHCDFSEANSTPALIEAELEASERAMARFGLKPTSFIFPGNFAGHIELLDTFGYKSVRHKTQELKEIGFPEKLSKNVLAIHDSMSFDLSEAGWDLNYLTWKARKYIDRAIEKRAMAHFWFHPSISKEYMLGYMFPVLKYIADRRTDGSLDIMTMQDITQLPAYCLRSSAQ